MSEINNEELNKEGTPETPEIIEEKNSKVAAFIKSAVKVVIGGIVGFATALLLGKLGGKDDDAAEEESPKEE